MNTHFNTLQDLLLPILENNDRVGIMLSGGFDSAVMSWCLCKIVQDNKLSNTITFYTSPRPDNSITHAENISKAIQQDFDINLKHKMRGDGKTHHSNQVWSGMLIAMNENDAVLTAETKVPEHMVADHFSRKVVNKQDFPNAFQPLINHTKDFTVALAIEQDLTFIMEMSHSCTETPNKRCETCWWCRERQWAFKENNYNDPGTL